MIGGNGAQQLRVLIALPEDPGLVTSTHIGWLTTSVTPGSHILFWHM